MNTSRTAAEPDLLYRAGDTLFLRVSELAAEIDTLVASRAAGKVVVVLPDWEMYTHGEGYLLVLKLQWNLPATHYIGFDRSYYDRLREVIRADRLFLHADIDVPTLQQTQAGEPVRNLARAVVRERAFLVNGLADGLIQLAYTLRQPPWRDVAVLQPLRDALPRVRPKTEAGGASSTEPTTL